MSLSEIVVILVGCVAVGLLIWDGVLFTRVAWRVLRGRISYDEYISNKRRTWPGSGFKLWEKYHDR